MTATTNAAATEAPTKRKPSRPKKVQQETEAGPVDFKALAAETRAKMNSTKKPASSIAKNQATPVEDASASVPVDTAVSGQVGPILEGSKVTSAPLVSLRASPLNPRKHFEPSSIAELAESILHKGLMQNLVVRLGDQPNTYEVIAGGRRLKALMLLSDAGRIPPLFDVPIRLAVLTDLEALQLATAENVERRSMSPIEEADAFAGMVALGATPEDIALKFGYALKTVQQRLVLAGGLGKEARELFNAGKIGLGVAQVIAQTSGPLLRHVMENAKLGYGVGQLQGIIKRSSFLVEYAKFDVAASGLEILSDLFGDTPERFADPKAAMAAQLDWIKVRTEKLRAGKAKFVEVISSDGGYLSLPYDSYSSNSSHKDLHGAVLMYSTTSGEVREFTGVAKSGEVRSREQSERAKEKAATANEATGSTGGAIRKAGWIDGHAARAVSIRMALLGENRRTVALTVLSMLGGDASKMRVAWEDVEALEVPEVRARLLELDGMLGGLLGVKPEGDKYARCPVVSDRFSGNWRNRDGQEFAFYTALMKLDLPELLDLQGILISCTLANWNKYYPEKPTAEFIARLGEDVNARPTLLLTDAHLKAYTKDRLIELAKDAGLDHAAMAKLGTSKLVREAILAHADELFAQGYVPAIARFPEPLPPLPAAEAASGSASDEDEERDEDLDEEGSEDDSDSED